MMMGEGLEVSEDTREERQRHGEIRQESGLIHSLRNLLKPLWFGRPQKIDETQIAMNEPLEETVEEEKITLAQAKQDAEASGQS